MKSLFYKPIKIKTDTNAWFWADLHLGQQAKRWAIPLYSIRGFSNIQEHDEHITNVWNQHVNHQDTIFILGDIIFGAGAADRLHQYFNTWRFKTLYLLFGNHTSGTKQLFNRVSSNEYYLNPEKKVVFCPPYVEAKINGSKCVISHYPIASFNQQHRGSYMIHGHSHGNLYGTKMGEVLYSRRVIDVGVDCCPAPLTLGQIKDRLDILPQAGHDHHK